MSELAKTNEEAFMDAYRTVMNTSKSFAPRIQQLRRPIEQLLREGVDMKVITKALNKYGIPCKYDCVRRIIRPWLVSIREEQAENKDIDVNSNCSEKEEKAEEKTEEKEKRFADTEDTANRNLSEEETVFFTKKNTETKIGINKPISAKEALKIKQQNGV